MIERKRNFCLTLGLLLAITTVAVHGQENIFALMKSDMQLADEYYQKGNYQQALDLYGKAFAKNSAFTDLEIKRARCYFFLKEYRQASLTYEAYQHSKAELPEKDLYYYAEAQASSGNYRKAIETYRVYLKKNPNDTIAAQKIWRLSNAAYLYEDSIHYAVRPISVNTEASEICPRKYKDGLMFISNRREVEIIEKLNQSNTSFYKTYFAKAVMDSIRGNVLSYRKPTLLAGDLNSKLHSGPMAFYDNEKKMVFASSGQSENHKQARTLQLYFAEEKNGKWRIVQPFPYNSNEYSMSDPTITADGSQVYFSADMKGGFGGTDIYQSNFQNGSWTKPINLGAQINTPYDEVSPFIHQDGTLYFSSNGHAGLGGLDIFKVREQDGVWGEVVNAGYPINTTADEFGLTVDSLGTHGYFSSNRKRNGFDDDLYEFDMDLQHYPLTISGIIHTKENNFTDSAQLHPFAKAKMLLIDNIRNVTVYETFSDENGNFSIVVPHFSRYRISIIGSDSHEHIVSLEIPKNRRMNGKHEIVIVKDFFQSLESQNVK